MNETFAGRGVQFVSIDRGERSEGAERYLDELNVSHIILNDPDRKVAELYRLRGIPLTVIVDQDGRVIFRHIGFSEGDEERYAKEIEKLLAWRDAAV